MKLNNWQKLLIVALSGAAVYGLGFLATIYVSLAQPIILCAGAVAALCTALTGYSSTT